MAARVTEQLDDFLLVPGRPLGPSPARRPLAGRRRSRVGARLPRYLGGADAEAVGPVVIGLEDLLPGAGC